MSLDFEMISGNDKLLNIFVKDKAGAVAVITGAIAAKFGLFNPDGTVVFLKTLADAIEIIDGAAGHMRVTLVPDDTEALDGHYLSEGEVINAAGKTLTITNDGGCEKGDAHICKNLITT